jgi:hypothetical protein
MATINPGTAVQQGQIPVRSLQELVGRMLAALLTMTGMVRVITAVKRAGTT